MCVQTSDACLAMAIGLSLSDFSDFSGKKLKIVDCKDQEIRNMFVLTAIHAALIQYGRILKSATCTLNANLCFVSTHPLQIRSKQHALLQVCQVPPVPKWTLNKDLFRRIGTFQLQNSHNSHK